MSEEPKKREAAKLNEKTAKDFELVGNPRDIYHIPCHKMGRVKVEDITPEQAKELVEKGCGSIKAKVAATEEKPKDEPKKSAEKEEKKEDNKTTPQK